MVKTKAYLAGSLLFLDGSVLLFFAAPTAFEKLIAGIYILGSCMFIMGTLAKEPA